MDVPLYLTFIWVLETERRSSCLLMTNTPWLNFFFSHVSSNVGPSGVGGGSAPWLLLRLLRLSHLLCQHRRSGRGGYGSGQERDVFLPLVPLDVAVWLVWLNTRATRKCCVIDWLGAPKFVLWRPNSCLLQDVPAFGDRTFKEEIKLIWAVKLSSSSIWRVPLSRKD